MQQTTNFFVKFGAQVPKDFVGNQSYPVFGIDVVDLDDGEDTRFLLANRLGEFKWVSTKLLRRQPNYTNQAKVLTNTVK